AITCRALACNSAAPGSQSPPPGTRRYAASGASCRFTCARPSLGFSPSGSRCATGSGGGGEEALDPRREAVARLLMADDALVHHPVELDDAPLADDRLVAVPGIGRHLEGEQRALDRRDLDDRIGEALGRAQEAQPAARRLPVRVHVEEDGDELGLAVG